MTSFLREFAAFLLERKKYWLLPVFIVMAIFGGLIVLTQGTAVAPFIYTLFLPAMRVPGVFSFFYDSAAPMIAAGRIVAAPPGERFTRKKFDANYPRHAIEYCLNAGGVTLADVDYVAFYDKPFLKFERLLETYLTFSPRGFRSFRMALPLWLREKLFLKSL